MLLPPLLALVALTHPLTQDTPPAPGLVVLEQHVRVSAEGEGEGLEEARENARTRALAEAMRFRGVEVRSEVKLRQQESSTQAGTRSDQDLTVELTTAARGRLVGVRPVAESSEQPAPGRYVVRLTLELPREALDPAWRIRAILEGPVPGEHAEREQDWRAAALADFCEEAAARDDLEAVELACRMGLRRRPEASLLLRLCLLQESVGRSAEALGTLERWRPRLAPTPALEQDLGRLERRLRGLAVDGDALIERLRKLVRGADRGQMELDHNLGESGTARAEDVVRIRGLVPADHHLYAIALDPMALQTPDGEQWRIPPADLRGRPVVLGSPLALVRLKLRQSAEDLHPGQATIVFLARAPDSPPPPLLDEDIELALCRGPHPSSTELPRLSAFVEALAAWLKLPGNQALAVSWHQTR